MNFRRLGPEGPRVSAVGIGCMYMSIDGRPSEADAVRALHAAFDAGVTFLDTADVYCLDDGDLGHSERLIHKALQDRKDKVVVATKGGLRRPRGAWTRDASPAHLREACEKSLRALGVSTLEVYQLHAPDPRVPFTESVGTLARLREEGKVAHVGLSNVDVPEIKAAQSIVPIVSVQNRWNPRDRSPERDGVLDHCTREGIAFLPYSPFGGASGAPGIGRMSALRKEAARHGLSPHRLVLGWMLAKSPVVVPIPGVRRTESATDSAGAGSIPALSPTDVQAVEAAFGA